MPSTKIPLKYRFILASVLVAGWTLSMTYLLLKPNWVPEWTCYVPVVLSVRSRRSFTKRRLAVRFATAAGQ